MPAILLLADKTKILAFVNKAGFERPLGLVFLTLSLKIGRIKTKRSFTPPKVWGCHCDKPKRGKILFMESVIMTKKILFSLAAFLLTGTMTFGAWDSGITQPWEQGLSVYPSGYAPYFSVTYPSSTSTLTNVDINCAVPGLAGCVTAQDVTSMVTDTSGYMLAATIDFDNNAGNLAEIGLSACVSGDAGTVNGYLLGINPYNTCLALEKVIANESVVGDTGRINEGFDNTLTYNMKLVVNGGQVDGYLYDMTGVELQHVSLTDTTPLTGIGAGTYMWNAADDISTVAPQGNWLDCRIAPLPIPGDANYDGKVDGSDVTILAGNWQVGVDGLEEASWDMGDFNGDKKVDGSDVTILAGNWQAGVDAQSSAVPEPSSLALLLTIAGAGLVAIRRK